MLVDEIRKIYDENIDRVNEQFDLEVKIHNEKILKQFDKEYDRIINEIKESAKNGKDEMMVYVSNSYFVKPIQQKLFSEGFGFTIGIYQSIRRSVSLFEMSGLLRDKILDKKFEDEQRKEFLISWRK